jgi:hypothetical protein
MPYQLTQYSCLHHARQKIPEPVVVKESERYVGPSCIEFDPIWGSSQNVEEEEEDEVRDRSRTDSRSSYKRIQCGRSRARGGETKTEIDCTLDETRKERAQNIPELLQSCPPAHDSTAQYASFGVGSGALPVTEMARCTPDHPSCLPAIVTKMVFRRISPSCHAIVCDKQSRIDT